MSSSMVESDWAERAGQCAYLARWLSAPPDEALRRTEAEEAPLARVGGEGPYGARPAALPSLEELQVEHAALFAAPGPRFLHACESVYRDKFEVEFTGCGLAGPAGSVPVEGLLWGPTTPRVLQAYRSAGWDLPDRCPYPPDHIALELEFYARLLSCVRTGASDMERAREFFAGHLDAWAPTFFRKLARTSGLAFYQRVGRAGLRWSDAERRAWGGGHSDAARPPESVSVRG